MSSSSSKLSSFAAALDAEKLSGRIDFYESCIDQLRKDLPKYLRHQNEANKTSKLLIKVFRNAASAENNQQLQSSLFMHAQKYEILEEERNLFSKCESQCESLIDDAKSLLIAPIREILVDYSASRKKAEKQNDFRLTQGSENALPIHTHMFEKHRIKSLKKILSIILTAELKYHCKAVEEISLVLSSLKDITEEKDPVVIGDP